MIDVEEALDENLATGVTGVVHRITSEHYHSLDDDVYFPVNHWQIRDLLGRMLTQLDAMVLPERSRKAAKTLLVQTVWRWWSEAAENCTTSGQGCIAPVVMTERKADGGLPEVASNRWGWESEQMYLDAMKPGAIR